MQDTEQPTPSAGIEVSEIIETWKQERSAEERRSFVESKLSSEALADVVL